MGCAVSHLLEEEGEEYGKIGHHIVSLTSTTYGLLTLESPPNRLNGESMPKRVGISPSPVHEPEIINSWELMAGLDNESFRFSPIPTKSVEFELLWPLKPSIVKSKPAQGKENSGVLKGVCSVHDDNVLKPLNGGKPVEKSEKKGPIGGENAVVIYTTSLRGIRKTFDDCNFVREAFVETGVRLIERDISMDLGFREELRGLMKAEGCGGATLPRVFVRGVYLGGVDEVAKNVENGGLEKIVSGLPKGRFSTVCDGCGTARFLPCFSCDGSCKLVKEGGKKVIRCPDCNENGLILCPICC